MSDRRAGFPEGYRSGAERAPPAPASSAPQRDPYEQPQYAAPYNYWAPYGPGGTDPSGAYGGAYGSMYASAANPAWAYGGDRYAEPSRVDRSHDGYDGARKRRISDYEGRAAGRGAKRQSYVPEADMRLTVARVVSDRAPRGSSGDRIAVSVGLLDQYILSDWHDAQSFAFIHPGDGDYRNIGRTRVRTRQKAFAVRWHHIGRRGVRFDADPRVHDAPFVGSAEDEWTVAHVGRAFGHALDHGVDVDLPSDLRPEALYCGGTWSRAWYYGDAFGRFACDVVLEFRTRSGYNQRSPAYVCAPWWAVEVWDMDLQGRRTRFVTCPEYLRAYDLGPIVPTPTPLCVSNFSAFHLGAQEHPWRRDFARPFVLREALYATLYAFLRAAQGLCISAYRDPRLYTKESGWGVLVPLPSDFVEAIRTAGLDALLDGSEFGGVRRSALVKCAVGRAAFDIDWEAVRDEAEYGHEIFCLYDYETGRVYGCDEQVGFVSGDRRTYRAYDVRLRASAMSMEQYREHCEFYAANSPVYVKDAWMMRASSPRPSPPAQVEAPDDAHEAYDSYAVTDEPSLPGVTVREESGDVAPRASLSGGLDLQPLLDRITSLAGENVALKRDAADKDKRIAELEEKLRSSEEALAAASDRADDAAPTSPMPAGPPASQTELELLRTRVTSAESAAVATGRQRDGFRDALERYSRQAGEMFLAMHGAECPIERARLCVVGVRAMYGRIKLRLGGSESPAREFLDETLALFGQARSETVARAELDKVVADSAAREAIWTEYATAIETRLSEAVQTVEASSAAWLDEQRKFRELAKAVQALGETVERQAGSLANVSDVLRGVGGAPPRPPSRSSGASGTEDAAVTSPASGARAMSPEV